MRDNENTFAEPLVAADEGPFAVGAQANKHATQSGHSWTDTYFDNKVAPDDLVAVFDWNYDAMRRLHSWRAALYFLNDILVGLVFYLFLIYLNENVNKVLFLLLVCGPMIYRHVQYWMNRAENVHGLHVAVTRQGVRYDRNHYPSASFYRTSTMIPYDEIDRIFVMPACYNVCGGGGVCIVAKADKTSLTLPCLVDSEGFVALVLTGMMKQQQPKPAMGMDVMWATFC